MRATGNLPTFLLRHITFSHSITVLKQKYCEFSCTAPSPLVDAKCILEYFNQSAQKSAPKTICLSNKTKEHALEL